MGLGGRAPKRRHGCLALGLVASLLLASAPAEGRTRAGSCPAAALQPHLKRMLGGEPGVLRQKLCFDVTRDRRADVAVAFAPRGLRGNATHWALLRSTPRGLRRVAGGRRGHRGDRAAPPVRLRRRGTRLLVYVPLWAAGEPAACPSRIRRLRLGAVRGRVRRIADRIDRARGAGCAEAPIAPDEQQLPQQPPPGPTGQPRPLPRQPLHPVAEATGDDCFATSADSPDLGVAVRDIPDDVHGKVLGGQALRSQVLPPSPSSYVPPDGLAPHYPGGALPQGQPRWAGLDSVAPEAILRATEADATFNAEDARHRFAFHLSHYGGMPDTAGDFNGDGVEDLAISEHFSYVDGMQFAGEAHVYFGRRGARIDPRRHLPDIIFYGDEAHAKFGIAVIGVGDVNGDGWDDLALSASFRDTGPDRGLTDGGQVYLVYGGFLHRYRCPVKVRAEDIGTKVPGIVFDGGHDGRRYTGWANSLEGGDFNGDGLADIIIGAYDPYARSGHTFSARGYLILGSRSLPQRLRDFRLGIDTDRAGVQAVTFELPDHAATNKSLGFGTFFVGDLNGDGRDELAFSASRDGPSGRGIHHVFLGRPLPAGQGTIPIPSSDVKVTADATTDAVFLNLESARPAGDFNGDGATDLLLTARASKRRINGSFVGVGAAGILYGRSDLPSTLGFSELDVMMMGTEPGWIGHPAMDRGADLDQDGYSDVVLNSAYYIESIGSTEQYRGRLWVIRGRPDQAGTIDVPDGAALHVVADTRLPGMFGYTWNTGDWDGNGRPDLVVGDHYLGNSRLHDHAGVAYLFYNGSSLRVP